MKWNDHFGSVWSMWIERISIRFGYENFFNKISFFDGKNNKKANDWRKLSDSFSVCRCFGSFFSQYQTILSWKKNGSPPLFFINLDPNLKNVLTIEKFLLVCNLN